MSQNNTVEYVRTPRGNFKIRFETIEEAISEGFYQWFTSDDGHEIVGDGQSAFAVRN